MDEYTAALDELKGGVATLTAAVEGYRKDAVDRSTVEAIVTDLLEKQAKAEEKAPRRSFEPSDTVAEALGKQGVERLAALHETPARDIAPLVSKSKEEITHLQQQGDRLLLISAIRGVKPQATRFYSDSYRPLINAAINTDNAGEGADWVPTMLSPDLIDRVELQLKVLALFGETPMPSNPYELPGRSVDRKKLARGVQNDADTAQTAVKKIQIGSRKVTLTAKKFWGEALVSKEAEEDAIIAQMPLIQDELQRYLRFDLEDAALNGDTAAALDTAAGFYLADDPLKNWDGLRKLALAAAKTDAGNVALTAAMTRTNRKKMGKYGVDPLELAHIVSIAGYIELLSDAATLTLEKYGPLAVVLTGELAKVDNVPVIVSEKMHDDLNATGVYDNVTTNRTECITVYRPGFTQGTRRGLTIEILRELYSEFDQDAVKVSTRKALAAIQPAATEPIVAITYNAST
jgi:HK97 family phage major capsid protein